MENDQLGRRLDEPHPSYLKRPIGFLHCKISQLVAMRGFLLVTAARQATMHCLQASRSFLFCFSSFCPASFSSKVRRLVRLHFEKTFQIGAFQGFSARFQTSEKKISATRLSCRLVWTCAEVDLSRERNSSHATVRELTKEALSLRSLAQTLCYLLRFWMQREGQVFCFTFLPTLLFFFLQASKGGGT